LPLPAVEKLEILAALASDPDDAIRLQALATLESWDTGELAQVLSDRATPRAVLEFALESLKLAREDLLEAVFLNPALFDSVEASPSPSPVAAEASAVAEATGPGDTAVETETLLQRIGRMSASEKIRAALMGVAEERLILIRDGNKAVARAVLFSPKLTERELEAFAAMKNVAEEVLRALAVKRSFVRHYPVVRALTSNSRAPIDAVLPLLPRLNDRDLRVLAVNRNVADAVRQAAARLSRARR
jgi:hypothetical protein